MLTENAPKSQLACGKLPTSGQIETLSLSFSPSRSSLVAQTHFKRATIQLTRDTLRGSSPATPRDGTPAVCWIPKGIQCHQVTDHPVPSRPGNRIHSPQKKICCSGAIVYWQRPLGQRIRPAIQEQESPRRSFRSLLFQESILGAVRTVPDLPASTRNHRDLAAWPPSRQGQN